MKRFLVGPVGSEICGPLMAPDERAFFCSIQHPGANDVAGVDFSQLRLQGVAPTSNFPDGGAAWPRSAVIVVTKDDGGPKPQYWEVTIPAEGKTKLVLQTQ